MCRFRFHILFHEYRNFFRALYLSLYISRPFLVLLFAIVYVHFPHHILHTRHSHEFRIVHLHVIIILLSHKFSVNYMTMILIWRIYHSSHVEHFSNTELMLCEHIYFCSGNWWQTYEIGMMIAHVMLIKSFNILWKIDEFRKNLLRLRDECPSRMLLVFLYTKLCVI